MNIKDILEKFDEAFTNSNWCGCNDEYENGEQRDDVKAFLISSIQSAFEATGVEEKTPTLELMEEVIDVESYCDGHYEALTEQKALQDKFMERSKE